jgi:ribosomal protein S18 acetylase RimI-like enzyme
VTPAPGLLEIRPATADDVPAMRAVGVRTWQTTYAGVLPPAEVANGIAEFFNEYSLGAAVRSGRMLVAVRDGALVGLLESDRPDPARAVVWKLYVAPEAQGAGVGRALVERYLAASGAPEVGVEHDERNTAAAAFFEALGFAVDEIEDAGGARTVRRVRRLDLSRDARR